MFQVYVGDVPLVCSEGNANAIWKPAYKLHIKRLLVNWIQIFVICSADFYRIEGTKYSQWEKVIW